MRVAVHKKENNKADEKVDGDLWWQPTYLMRRRTYSIQAPRLHETDSKNGVI